MPFANELDRKRKRFLFVFVASSVTLAFIVLSFIDFLEADYLENLIDGIVIAIMLGGIVALKAADADALVYRTSHFIICLCFFYSVSIGAGEETVLYWVFIMPLLFFYFFGKREGLVWNAFFALGLALIIISAPYLIGHLYRGLTIGRFFLTLTIVVIISYGLEASRSTYGRLADERNQALQLEKQRLEKALSEIKQLSGLIPICSNCKKIRNDEGFWEQVETYIRNRSDADFSHGICPDCAAELYPDFIPSKS